MSMNNSLTLPSTCNPDVPLMGAEDLKTHRRGFVIICKEYLLGKCARRTIIVGMCCGTVVYVIFGVLCVYRNIYIPKLCNISHLMEYMIVSIIYAWFRSVYTCFVDKKTKAMNVCCIGGYLFGELAIVMWGFVEIYGIPNIGDFNSTRIHLNNDTNKTACADLVNSDMWEFGLISTMIQTVFVGLLFITCCYFAWCKC